MNLRNRHFVKLLDFAPNDLVQLVNSASTLKRLQMTGHERRTLEGKDLAFLYQGSASAVRWTAQVAASRTGLSVHSFGSDAAGVGPEDSLSCTGRQLGRLFHAVALSQMEQEKVEELARTTGVPVVNLGSFEFEPLAVLGDFLTMAESSTKPFDELSVVFLGDGTTGLAQSFLVGASKFGLDVRFCGPKGMHPEENLTETCLALAAETDAQIRIFTEPEEAIKGADFVVSQSWGLSQKDDWEGHCKKLMPYRVTSDLLAQSGHGRCKLLHHLPVLLPEDSEFAESVYEKFELDGMEMSRELFDSAANLSFEQCENRLHCCKAIFVCVLG